MKRNLITYILLLSCIMVGCTDKPIIHTTSTAALTALPTTPMPTPVPTIAPTALPTPVPTPAPTPSPTVFGETPEHWGSGDILFDVYEHTALVDLNGDGTPEELIFTAGVSSSTIQINSNTYTINRSNQAQLFAITDVDISDNILELAFTDEYDGDLADNEFPFTYLFWWNGTDLINMGGLMDMKFAGAWRSDFDPSDNFDAYGIVMCLTDSKNFSDVWYTGHYIPDGTDRKLKEELYVAPVLFHQEPLVLKEYILLLKKIDNTYFDFSYAVIWDYASGSGGYAWKPRDYSDEIVAFIPQEGEELTITHVYGKRWFKLQASDGKSGWLKCVDMKVYGYWPVMGDYFTAYYLFDGIVTGG